MFGLAQRRSLRRRDYGRVLKTPLAGDYATIRSGKRVVCSMPLQHFDERKHDAIRTQFRLPL